MKPQKTIFAGLSIFLLTACNGSLPSKPDSERGYIDYPRSEVITGHPSNPDLITRVPLEQYDKATCFRPREWEAYSAYVEQLEAYAKEHQAAELGAMK